MAHFSFESTGGEIVNVLQDQVTNRICEFPHHTRQVQQYSDEIPTSFHQTNICTS